MAATTLAQVLGELGLDPVGAAQLLAVSARTVRRWLEAPTEVPGPANEALRAWAALQRAGLPWKPDDTTMVGADGAQMSRYRQHAVELFDLLERVERRGGPAAPWVVDVEKGSAILGPLHVGFYRLANGGFSMQSYRRADGSPDIDRDRPLLEDAVACFARALAARGRRPFEFAVTLQGTVVLLWDVQQVPTVVMRVPCALIRSSFVSRHKITDEQCRFLVSCNKDLMTEVAKSLYAEERYLSRDDGIRVMTPTASDLTVIADRFSCTALTVTPYWVSDDNGRATNMRDYAVIAMGTGQFGIRALSKKAEQRAPGALKIGHSAVFRGRADAREYVEASELQGFAFSGRDQLF